MTVARGKVLAVIELADFKSAVLDEN